MHVRAGPTRVLVDCGEGAQRALLNVGAGFVIHAVALTHMHGDHWYGLPGLLRTFSLNERHDPLDVLYPVGSPAWKLEFLAQVAAGCPYPVTLRSLAAGDTHLVGELTVTAVEAQHRIAALAYVLTTPDRPGAFDAVKATQLGVPAGPERAALLRGEIVAGAAGAVHPSDVVGPARPGLRIVISGDTLPSPAIREAARGADVLVHEATFSDEHAARARETGHSTIRQACELAAAAGAQALILTHFSQRVADSLDALLDERVAFPDAVCATDGLLFDVSSRR